MRTANRLLAPLAALALIAIAVLITVEVVAAGFHRAPVLIHWHQTFQQGRHNVWRSSGPITISASLLAIGIVLLVSQLVPRRVSQRELAEMNPGVRAAISTGGLRTSLKAAALTVDGVSSAKVAITRHKAVVKARTAGGSRERAAELMSPVETATLERLTAIGLAHPPRLKITVTPGKAAS